MKYFSLLINVILVIFFIIGVAGTFVLIENYRVGNINFTHCHRDNTIRIEGKITTAKHIRDAVCESNARDKQSKSLIKEFNVGTE